MTRKPTNMLKMSKKPSLKKSPVLAEIEKNLKEKQKRTKGTAEKAAKPGKKPATKAAVKKTTAKKGKDPLWKNLAIALKNEG